MMTDKEIIEKLLNGYSLRTFMIPDESIPSNYPEHIESYDLPHIIINGEYFWGKSATTHLSYELGSSNINTSAFCYTNIGDVFCSYTTATGAARFMREKRYKEHVWHVEENYKLIWDSEKGGATEIVGKEIELCSRFKIAMLDLENIWNIHPVDLPMYYPSSRTFILKTVMDFYPSFLRYPAHIMEFMDNHQDFLGMTPAENVSLRMEVQGFPSFYALGSDGTYSNFFDIQRETSQKYKRLKIFVDKA